MTKEVRPIDANALALRIREYMDDYPNSNIRHVACRAVLSMLGDEGQTPTIRADHFPNLTKMVPLTLEQLRGRDGQPVWIEDLETTERSSWRLIYWDRGKYLVLIAKSNYGYILEDYGKSWLAYAYPPSHIDTEMERRDNNG